jgi:hypothetical protein
MFHNFRTFMWSSTNFMPRSIWDYHSYATMASLEWNHTEEGGFLNRAIWATVDEPWVSFVNVNQRVIKAMDIHEISWKCLNKSYVPESWMWLLGQEGSANVGIHATLDCSNVKCTMKQWKRLHRGFQPRGAECCFVTNTAGTFQLGIVWPPTQVKDIFDRHTESYSQVWQVSQFWRLLHWEVAQVFTCFLPIIFFIEILGNPELYYN